MTDREIKLELAKAALSNGSSIDTAKVFYNWIIAAPEHESVDKFTELDTIPIEQLAYKTRYEVSIINRCSENGINTVGDLIRCGAHKFKTSRYVGRKLVSIIDDALSEHYGINDWYKT